MTVPLRSVRPQYAQGVAVDHAARSFESFFETQHRGLFAALCLVTGNRHEAEEIMQDAFLRLWERWDRVAGLDDPAGYLYRTAMNVFRKRYRRASLALRKVVAQAPGEDDLAAVEDRDVLVRAVRDLIPQQRAAIVLTALLDFSSEEAGRMLGMKASTVRVLAARARIAMRQTVGEPR